MLKEGTKKYRRYSIGSIEGIIELSVETNRKNWKNKKKPLH
jgi:hypothetical protein